MKLFIKNRKGQKLAVVIEIPENQKGVAYIMHGLGGFKDQPQVRVMCETVIKCGYVAVSFDVANTLGESEGRIEDASVTSYLEDLEDVIKWSKSEEWYQEQFLLMGHSLGGICVSLYAERYPERVFALAPLSTVVSGKLSLENTPASDLEEWKTSGWMIRESHSKPGVFRRIPWSEQEDRLKYDLLPDVSKLTMPVLLLVGEKDRTTPLLHQKMLYDKLPGKKELEIIKGAQHTFRDRIHLDQIANKLESWLRSLEKRLEFHEVSILLAYNDKDEVLLQDRHHASKVGEKWAFFGGHLEKAEKPLEALEREIKEELGLELKNPQYLGSFDVIAKGKFIRRHLYTLLLNEEALKNKIGEGWEHCYFSLEEARSKEMFSGDNRALRILEKYLKV